MANIPNLNPPTVPMISNVSISGSLQNFNALHHNVTYANNTLDINQNIPPLRFNNYKKITIMFDDNEGNITAFPAKHLFDLLTNAADVMDQKPYIKNLEERVVFLEQELKKLIKA